MKKKLKSFLNGIRIKLIRMLGGIEDSHIPMTEYSIMRTRMEHLRHRLVLTMEEAAFVSPDYIRSRMVHEIAKNIVGRVRIRKSAGLEPRDLVEIYEIDLWVSFDPPMGTRVEV